MAQEFEQDAEKKRASIVAQNSVLETTQLALLMEKQRLIQQKLLDEQRAVENHPQYSHLQALIHNSKLNEALTYYYGLYPEFELIKTKNRITRKVKQTRVVKPFNPKIERFYISGEDESINTSISFHEFQAHFKISAGVITITLRDSYYVSGPHSDDGGYQGTSFSFNSLEEVLDFIAQRIAENKPFSLPL